MATRAAAFSAKVKDLQYYTQRLLMGNSMPSELNLNTTLKYFSHTLMGVLKDVSEAPLEFLSQPKLDARRLALYPSLPYDTLYVALTQLFDLVPLLQHGAHMFGHELLHTTSCLVPFLEHSRIDSLPYLVASSLSTFPESLHANVVNILCHYLLPFTLDPDVDNETSASVPAILMLTFQHTSNIALHCQLLETVMSRRRLLVRDLFTVIGYGTVAARSSAATLLFHYWPALNPPTTDRRCQYLKFPGLDMSVIGWEPHRCERTSCSQCDNNVAIQLCLDHNVAVLQGADFPPPLYVCQRCSVDLRAANPQISMFEILLPMQQVATSCENKNCRSTDKMAVCTCFHIECASYNGNRPIRYCHQCDTIRHNNRRGATHVTHHRIDSLWRASPDLKRYMIEAIVSLLKEAHPLADNRRTREQERHTRAGLLDDTVQMDWCGPEEGRALSRYGVWLLINLCTPDCQVSEDVLARLLAALFSWFEATAYLGDDQAGGALEMLKSEYIHSWLQKILQTYFETFASCLMPRPPEVARVGGHWESLVSKTQHIQEGFHRLFCLVPYDIISGALWNHIMPNWLEAIRQDVTEEELPELRGTLSKLLDPDMSPLGFDADLMYQFMSARFLSAQPRVHEQALNWLQILSMLRIAIPLPIIHKMFRNGVRCLSSWREPNHTRKISFVRQQGSELGPVEKSGSRSASSLSGEGEGSSPGAEAGVSVGDGGVEVNEERTPDNCDMVVPCFVLMLDVLLNQMEIQDVSRHQGLPMNVSQQAVMLLKSMLSSPTEGRHTCLNADSAHQSAPLESYMEYVKEEGVDRVEQCGACESLLQLYQLAAELLAFICPAEQQIQPVDVVVSGEVILGSPQGPGQEEAGPGPSERAPLLSGSSDCLGAALAPPLQMVTDLVGALNVSPATTCTESGKNAGGGSIEAGSEVVDGEEKWNGNDPRLRFSVEELPAELQLLYGLLNRMRECDSPDVVAHLLACLRLLVLHGECLQRAARDQYGFHVWCQQNLVVQPLWHVLCTRHSQAAETAVPLLLHAVTLPHGGDVFWHIVERHFQSSEWRVRFMAVERATVLARFVSPALVAQCGSAVLTPLMHVFSYLIRSVDDVCTPISQKAHIFIDTIPDNGIRVMCLSLETQFDSVILDRPLVLKTILQMFNLLPTRRVLSWEFFNSRFDTLIMETQLSMENRGELSLVKENQLADDQSTSENYMRRLNRAQVALSAVQREGTSHRTLSSSIGAKWPYKRTMSAPLMAPRTDRCDVLKYTYLRQTSAPVLKRKMSRFSGPHTNQLTECARSSAITLAGTLASTDSMMTTVYRYMDSDDGDRETCHLLIDLLMKFLCRPEPASVNDEKQQLKSQQQSLKHLAMCLAYNQSERTFFMSPQRLRSTASFNAFLSQLCAVLDGSLWPAVDAILHLAVPVLLYAAAPNRHEAEQAARPGYGLWHLEQHQRHDWLQTLLVIVYKHDVTEMPLSNAVVSLCRVTLNTLAALLHDCKPVTAAAQPSDTAGDGYLQRGGGSPPTTTGVILATGVSSESDMSPPASVRRELHPPSASLEAPLSESTIRDSTATLQPGGNEVDVNSAVIPTLQTSSVSRSTQEAELRDETPYREQTVIHMSADIESESLPTGQNLDQSVCDSVEISQQSSKNTANEAAGTAHQSDSVIPSAAQTSAASGIRTAATSLASKQAFFEHSMSLDIVPLAATRLENGAGIDPTPNQRTHSIAVPSLESGSGAVSAERSLFDRLTQVFSRQNTQEMGSTARLVSSLQLGLSAVADIRVQDPVVEVTTSDSSQADDAENTSVRQKTLGNKARVKKLKMSALEVAGGAESSAGRRQRGGSVHTIEEKWHSNFKASTLRVGDNCVTERCVSCGRARECYGEEEVGLCVVVLSTFIHRQPSLAAPMLPDILRVAAVLSGQYRYPWQSESSYHLSGSANSVSRQFLRCVLHRLSSYNVALKLFQLDLDAETTYMLYRTLVQCLADFVEYNMASPLLNLLESLNQCSTMPSVDELMTIFTNMSIYMDHLPLETGGALFASLLPPLDQLLRRLLPYMQLLTRGRWLLTLMTSVLRIPVINSQKSLMDSFCKLLSVHIQHWPLDFVRLVEVCQQSSRVFIRERDRYQLSRVVVFELVQALKFKTSPPHENLIMMVAFIVQDAGGVLPPDSSETARLTTAPSGGDFPPTNIAAGCTAAAECMRQHLGDTLDFLSDVHALSRVQNLANDGCAVNNGAGAAGGTSNSCDSLGSELKAILAQYAAIELARLAPVARDQRNLARHVPWLFSAPSSPATVQQGPKEFIECVSHMRMLSWLLIGSMMQQAASSGCHSTVSNPCQPVSADVSCHIADHIQLVMAGFVELSKTSVLHMSSLFHAFILCQLWTVYLDQLNSWQAATAAGVAAVSQPVAAGSTEPPSVFAAVVVDFWAKVTPAVLQLMSHSRVLSDMVSLHFVGLLEGLSECNSSSYTRLMPIWNQVFLSAGSQMPSHLRVRLQNCDQQWTATTAGMLTNSTAKPTTSRQLLWLRRIQVKLGQIEVQSSAATHFYTV